MRNVLVSVIIPVYNGTKYLYETLQSVIHQDFVPQIEVIVIEDSSPGEDSESIVREFKDVIYRSNVENMGVSRTRNKAAEDASGKYLAFLDQDDVWEPEFLRTMCNIMDSNDNIAMAFCNGQTIDSEGYDTGAMYQGIPGDELYDFLFYNQVATPSQVVLRKSAFESVGGFVISPVGRGADDWGLWLTLLAKGFRCTYVNSRLVNYRLHGEAAHHDHTSMKANERWLLTHHCRELGVSELRISLAVAAKSNDYKGDFDGIKSNLVLRFVAKLVRICRAGRRRLRLQSNS